MEVEPDPVPPPNRGRSKTPKAAPGRITVAVRKEVGKEIGGALGMLAQVWAIRDPQCGSVALQQVDALTASLTDWVCDHPSWVRYITEAATGGKAVRVVWDAWPILLAVYMHHIAKNLPDLDQDAYEGVDLAGFPAPHPGEFS